jgi:hypothetical protein
MPKTTGRAVGERRWSVVYWALMASFLMATALNLARVAGGFLTDYLADLTVPALLYVLARELAPGRRLALPRATQWVGRTPERAATVLLLASVGTELSQAVWPRGVFAGRFDLWDIVAYATGMVAVYGADRLCGAARQAKT